MGAILYFGYSGQLLTGFSTSTEQHFVFSAPQKFRACAACLQTLVWTQEAKQHEHLFAKSVSDFKQMVINRSVFFF